nr:phospholipid-transporting ATPase 2-like [Tanacetum cinerariifolium]
MFRTFWIYYTIDPTRWNYFNETKLGMSVGIAEPKLTAMDAMIDKLTRAIFIFQIVVVIVLGIAGNIWKDTKARKHWYVLYPEAGAWYELLIIPLRFELLCSIMIPISIKMLSYSMPSIMVLQMLLDFLQLWKYATLSFLLKGRFVLNGSIYAVFHVKRVETGQTCYSSPKKPGGIIALLDEAWFKETSLTVDGVRLFSCSALTVLKMARTIVSVFIASGSGLL